jgi:hypothetical protein
MVFFLKNHKNLEKVYRLLVRDFFQKLSANTETKASIASRSNFSFPVGAAGAMLNYSLSREREYSRLLRSASRKRLFTCSNF